MTQGEFPAALYSCDVVAAQRLFTLSGEASRAFAAIQSTQEHPKGTVLFSEGQPAAGIFLLGSGAARLSVCSSRGEKLVLRVARPGEILGLSANVSGKCHEVTAELTAASRVTFIRRKDFLRFLKEHPEACLQVVHMLSNDVHAAYDRVRAIGMGRVRHNRN